jgi:translation elongation factor EF-G
VSLKLNTKKLLQNLLNTERTYKKQSGGRGKFGDIVFRLEPADEVDGKVPVGLQFVNAVKVVTFLKNIFHQLKKVLEKL